MPVGITIDSETSKDLDDALWAKRQGTNIVVQVFIANVDQEVSKGGALDRRARERKESRYHTKTIQHLLPVNLAEHKLSLLPNEIRNTLLIQFEVATNGEIHQPAFYETPFRSKAKLSYEEVDQRLRERKGDFYYELRLLQEAAYLLNKKRRDQGAICGQKVGAVWIDECGKMVERPLHSQMLVSELMIATNYVVAKTLAEKGLPAIFRTHRLREETDTLLLSFLEEIGNQSTLQSVLGQFVARAEYDVEPGRHFGLQLDHYCHFTSPIRRYPDLVVHRQVRSIIHNQPVDYTTEDLAQICEELNEYHEQNREERREYLKSKAKKEVSKNVADQSALPGLATNQFTKVIKSAVRSNQIDLIREEVLRRFSKNQLVCQDYYFLWFELNDSEELRNTLLHELKNETILPSVISIAINCHEAISDGTVQEWREQTISSGFPCRYILTIDGIKMTTSDWLFGQDKKKSRKKAALAFIDAYINRELEPVESAQEKPGKFKRSETEANPIGFLFMYAEGKGIEKPVYEFKTIGPQQFECSCSFLGVGKKAQAPNKKEAKRLASQLVVDQLKVAKR